MGASRHGMKYLRFALPVNVGSGPLPWVTGDRIVDKMSARMATGIRYP
jgi:hypothetical protein